MATINGSNGFDSIDGGSGPDLIRGKALADQTDNAGDILNGLGGNDTLSGYGYDDTLDGGADNDVLLGGDDDDLLYGGSGNDNLSGDGGEVGPGGRPGIDTLFGGTGNDTLGGGALDDVLYGEADQDTLYGGTGNDLLDGGAGTDVASYADYGVRIVATLADNNAVSVSIDGVAEDSLVGIEGIEGGSAADTLTGDNFFNILRGNGGNDTIDGGRSPVDQDTLDGGDGIDTISFASATSGSGVGFDLSITGPQNTSAAGTDTIINFENIIGSRDGDTLTGDGGNNVIDGGGGNDNMNGLGGSDTASYATAGQGVTVSLAAQGAIQSIGGGRLALLQNFENLLGSGFADTLDGDGNANVLEGGGGLDTLRGGLGDDTYVLTDTNSLVIGFAPPGSFQPVAYDAVVEAVDAGLDTVRIQGTPDLSSYVLPDHVENGVAIISNPGTFEPDRFFSLAGNGLDNHLSSEVYTRSFTIVVPVTVRSSVTVTLQGGAGEDTLVGGGGSDWLQGGSDVDVLDGGEFDNSTSGPKLDTADYSDKTAAVAVTLAGANEATVFVGGVAEDTIRRIENVVGGSGADQITGDLGSNSLDGGAGNDVLGGGGGFNTLNGGTGSDTASFLGTAGPVSADLRTGKGSVSGVETETLLSIEHLTGGLANDVLIGDGSVNFLSGSEGRDALYGLDGNDVLLGGSTSGGANQLWGGNGSDTASYAGTSAAVQVDLRSQLGRVDGVLTDVMNSIENAIGGSGNDTLIGTDGANILRGVLGRDALYGLGGNDVLLGGGSAGGANQLWGGDGLDTASYEGDTAAVHADLRSQTGRVGGAITDTMNSIENLTGGSGNDVLIGTNAANTLRGVAGNDALYGLGGDDLLVGGGGNDQLWGGDGLDWADYSDQTLAVTIDLGSQTGSGAGAGRDTFNAIENARGGAGVDLIRGGAGANVIEGGGARDVLYGLGGPDTFVYRAASDSRLSTGYDTVADFDTGEDKLDLSAFGIDAAKVSIASSGSSTALYADTNAATAGYELAIAFLGAGAIATSDILF